MQLPRPAMREGPQYQAEIPEPVGPRPPGVEAEDPRSGTPGPSTQEALALAAGYEKQASDSLHIDAVADPEYHPGAGEIMSCCDMVQGMQCLLLMHIC